MSEATYLAWCPRCCARRTMSAAGVCIFCRLRDKDGAKSVAATASDLAAQLAAVEADRDGLVRDLHSARAGHDAAEAENARLGAECAGARAHLAEAVGYLRDILGYGMDQDAVPKATAFLARIGQPVDGG